MPKVDLKEMHSVASWPEPRVEPWQLRALLRVVRAAKEVSDCFGPQPGAHPINYLRNALSDIEDER